jgi:hypothetical protein
VPLISDTNAERHEHFFINQSNPVGATLERPYGIVSIAANDLGDRAPVANVSDVSLDEVAGVARFVIALDRSSGQPVTVNYATSNGTATAGADLAATAGSVVFAAGETAKIVEVPITNDAPAEGIETFLFNLTGISGVTGAVIGDGSARATIGQSDPPTLATPLVYVKTRPSVRATQTI